MPVKIHATISDYAAERINKYSELMGMPVGSIVSMLVITHLQLPKALQTKRGPGRPRAE